MSLLKTDSVSKQLISYYDNYIFNFEIMDRDKANIMRIRVNRVNIVQRIEPTEVLAKLVKFKVLEKSEAEVICKGRTKEDKARNLVDHLITKDHSHKDWYNHFRNILQDCNYKDLVIFLDNTIIKQPNFVAKFTNHTANISSSLNRLNIKNTNQSDHNENKVIDSNNVTNSYKQSIEKISNKKLVEKITNISFNEGMLNSITIKGHYERTLSNLQTFSIRPDGAIGELAKSNESDDLQQIDLENAAYILMRKLELLYSLYQNDESLKSSFFIDTDIVSTIISSSHNYLYMKYFKNLRDTFGIDMLKYFKDVFIEHIRSGISNLKYYENLDDLVQKLSWLFMRNEENRYAQEILTVYLHQISLLDENIDSIYNNSIWKSTINAQCLLLLIKNNLTDYKHSYEIFNSASKLITHIKNLSIETQIDCNQLYYGMSQTTLEEGSFDAAFDWCNKALMGVDYKDELLIDILGHATLCYSSKWLLSKAKTISLLGIQIAKSKYGKNHPNFVKALLYYGYYANEFLQDETAVFLAKYTLQLAKKVFGFDSLMIADAHKSLSKALMASKQFENDLYYEHASEAYKIASVYYSTDSPKLMSYQMALALALQWKGVQSNDSNDKNVSLNDALEMCKKVMQNSLKLFGEINCRTAQIYLLMGSIYLYLENLNEAEKFHHKSLDILTVVLPPNNYHVLFGKSTLGVFYKVTGRIQDAVSSLQDVVDELKDDYDGHISWIPTVYEYLIDCYKILELNDLANVYQKTLDKMKLMFFNKKTDFIIEMEKEPPQDLHYYVSNFLQR